MDPEVCLCQLLDRMANYPVKGLPMLPDRSWRDDIVEDLRNLADWIEKLGYVPNVVEIDHELPGWRAFTVGRTIR